MKYIIFNIMAKENLKIGSSIFQSDVENSRSYITGSAIRGAFIYNVILKNKGIDVSEDEKYRKMFFEGGVKFLNANIYDELTKKSALPFPLCYSADKQEIKKGSKKIRVYNDFTKHSERYDKYRKLEFFVQEDNVARKMNIKKIYSLHITKQKSQKHDKNDVGIYRYESIKKGQVFGGALAVEEKYLAKCEEILREGVFYLGGSKGTGYGKCEVNNIKITDASSGSYFRKIPSRFNNDFYIYFLSDAIIYDSYGRVSTIVEEKYLEKKLGVANVEYIDSRIATTVIGGYNSKWRCRLTQAVGVKAGSVLKYSFEGEIDFEKLAKFEFEGIGQRREEGFGQIMLLDAMDIETVVDSKDNYEEEKVMLSQTDKKVLRKIINRMFYKQLEKQVDYKLYKLAKDNKVIFKIGATQRGRLVNLFRTAQTVPKDEAIEIVEKFLSDIVRRKSQNTKITDQFKDSKIDGVRIDDYVEGIIAKVQSDDTEILKELFDIRTEDYELSEVIPKVTADDIFNICMKYLEKLFYNSMKERGA